ncbi:MAG TPA: PLP-dependent aminotransferase family protein [Thermoanaerobaculia bacterium]|nr:PLP-dependent aminotransferase family protein [Thermoanaerobaculia bacterium]
MATSKLLKLPIESPSGSPTLRLSRGAGEVRLSRLQEVMQLAARPGVLSFAVGMPAADLFPAEDLADAAARALTDRRVLQYGPPSRTVQEHVVRLMAERGVACRPEQVFLTSGAQQGMDLMARLLLDPEGTVLLEETVYDGLQMVIRTHRPRMLTVPTSAEAGLDVDAVEEILESGVRPAFLYAITDGHNPLGGSLPREKRLRLVELARRYGLPILEDDAYGFLFYDRDPEPPMRAHDDEWVFYLGSFSKIFAPALRVGWVVVPEERVPLLRALKHGMDVDTSSFSQLALAAYLEAGLLPAHLVTLRREYRRRRDAMLGALETCFAGRARWSRPDMGMFVWLEMPQGFDALAPLRDVIEKEGVAYSPGQAFAVQGRHHADSSLRLSFANLLPEQIEEGVRRLARAIL